MSPQSVKGTASTRSDKSNGQKIIDFDLAKYFNDANTNKETYNGCRNKLSWYQGWGKDPCYKDDRPDLKLQHDIKQDYVDLIDRYEVDGLISSLKNYFKVNYKIELDFDFKEMTTALNSDTSFKNQQGSYNEELISRSELVRYMQNKFNDPKTKLPQNTVFKFHDSIARSK